MVENVINGAIWIINRIIDGLDWAIEWTGLEIPHIDDVHLPRFRAGIDFVPYDKYPAYLDRGEAVLTAQEAEEYRKSKRESGAGFPPAGKEKEGTKTITQISISRCTSKRSATAWISTIWRRGCHTVSRTK